jgi:hypothetical protein
VRALRLSRCSQRALPTQPPTIRISQYTYPISLSPIRAPASHQADKIHTSSPLYTNLNERLLPLLYRVLLTPHHPSPHHQASICTKYV